MSDQLQSAADSLAEQTRKLDIASYYTHGDMEKAKQMVAGSYKDFAAIKVRFSSSSQYGVFLVFYNIVLNQLNSVYVLVSPSFAVEDIKTNIGWREFEKEIQDMYDKGEHDQVLCNHAREELVSGASIEFGNNLRRLIENNDAISINHMFKKYIEDRLGFQQIHISVDTEPISSLDMEIYSASSKKINEKDLEEARAKAAEASGPKEEIKTEDPNDPLAGREVKLILNGSLILSPIKGVDISELEVGTRIKLKILDKGPKAVQVAKAFNAYDEENQAISAIPGRIVSIKHSMKDGYHIFVIVAKGIYVRIHEEEESIKVAVEEADKNKKSAEDEGKTVSLPMLIALILLFIGIVATIIILVT